MGTKQAEGAELPSISHLWVVHAVEGCLVALPRASACISHAPIEVPVEMSFYSSSPLQVSEPRFSGV